jgi:hypothetical protein
VVVCVHDGLRRIRRGQGLGSTLTINVIPGCWNAISSSLGIGHGQWNLLPPFAVKWVDSWTMAKGIIRPIFLRAGGTLTAGLGVSSGGRGGPEGVAKVDVTKVTRVHVRCG